MNKNIKKMKLSGIVLIAIAFIVFWAAESLALTVVVDNEDGNYTKKEEFGFYLEDPGRWTHDTSQGYDGTHYVSNHNDAKEARWYPMLTVPDDYKVYFRWVADVSDRDDKAKYEIHYQELDPHGHYRDKKVEKELDQRINGDTWVYIDTFKFTGGKKEYIQLKGESHDKNVSADAVMFVSVGSVPTTTTSTTTTTTTTSTTSTTATTSSTTTTSTTLACPSLAISDVPLDSQLHPAPANIMFVLDDSGSMDWEFITSESNGLFSGYEYVFDNPGDNLYSYVLSSTQRKHWKSQWSEYNHMYYNPDPVIDYTPWPTLSDADPNTPRSHPFHSSPTFNLDTEYINESGISVKRAHYFTWDDADGSGTMDSGEKAYLVNLTSPITYYRFDDDGDNIIETGELVPVAASALPAAVITYWPPTDPQAYTMERQRFANWYSYYRRRELTAIASVSKVINAMQGVKIGIVGINGIFPAYQGSSETSSHHSPLPVRVGGTDDSSILLNALYTYVGQARGTPLRRGLEDVGQYYDQTDSSDGGISPTSPFALEADGGACEQCFTILLTDGYYNGSDPAVGNADKNKGAPYADNYSNTLGDVSIYYHDRDLDTSLSDKVPTNMYDSATHQHMVTYGVSFGVYGTLTPSGYDVINGPFPTWPDPNSSDSAKIDDLWHAAVNGRGLFFNANNPQELVDAMLTVMSSIEARTGSAASVSVNGDELYESVGSSIMMYQTNYFSDGWGGDVKAYNIDTNGDVITEPIAWSANDLVESFLAGSGYGNRIIGTYDGSQGIPFRYTNITSAQQAILSSGSVSGQQMLNYLRGDNSLEVENGGGLRTRYFALGDFVNSSATFIGDVLYAGSNDGMLHAFDAATGIELFSYIPGLVFDNLPNIADPAYSHNYFVDQSPYAKKMGDTTYLVGGLGKGGKGYYCLDITDPFLINTETVLSSRVKWEFPAAFDADMGYSFSRATIVKTAYTSLNSGTDLEGYVVIFGNGYQSANGNAVLYIVNPLNGALIRKIDTGSGTCNGLSTPVMVDVNNDSNVDYAYAGDLLGHLWKFDLSNADPNLWGIAFGTDGNGNQSIDAADSADVPKPLFTVQNNRPITTKPDVMMQCGLNDGYLVIFGTGKYLADTDLTDSSQQTLYGVWDYGDDDDNNEYLGMFDPSTSPPLSNQPAGVDLLEQTVDWQGDVTQNSAGDTIASQYLRVLSDNEMNLLVKEDSDSGQMANPGISGIASDNFDNNLDGTKDENAESDAETSWTTHLGWATDGVDNDSDTVIDGAVEKRAENITKSHAGWYFDLPISKEKITVDPIIRDGKVIVISYVPQATPCTGGGYSIVHELNACSGGRVSEPTIDINDDGVIDDKDLITITVADPDHPGQTITVNVAPTGRRYSGRLQPPAILRKTPVEIKYFSSSSGTIKTMKEKAEQRGMFYWRENRN